MVFFKKRPALSYEPRYGNQFVAQNVFFRQAVDKDYSLQKATTRGDRWSFEAFPGDHVEGQTDRVRSELQGSFKIPYGTEVWTSDWVKYSTPGAMIGAGQWHQTEDVGDFSGFPPYITEIMPNETINIYTAFVATPSRPTSYPHELRLSGYPFAANVWHRRVGQYIFGWSDDATLRQWVNGNQVLDLTGISMGMNDLEGVYYKFGAYGEQNNEQHIQAEYANIEVSTNSLSDRIANPIPVDE